MYPIVPILSSGAMPQNRWQTIDLTAQETSNQNKLPIAWYFKHAFGFLGILVRYFGRDTNTTQTH